MSHKGELEAILKRIKDLPANATQSDAIASVLGEDWIEIMEVRRRCALVRSFDTALYEFLTTGVKDAPSLQVFVAAGEVRRLSSKRWSLNQTVRASLLLNWQAHSTSEWRDWNERLAQYFLERELPEERLDALYHMAASPNPKQAVPLFRDWYAQADEEFDLAQCQALLEILRTQQDFRGPQLSQEWREYRRYYDARLLFGDDYYKTGAYFRREGLLEEFEKTLAPSAGTPWIFHIHATGGTGKTMFLRYLIARYLLQKRIPCARVDLDDFSLSEVIEYPTRLLARIFEQWAHQVPGTQLSYLHAQLAKESASPGWNANVLSEVARQLAGAEIHTHLVVILDTLEEVTLAATNWLRDCVRCLQDLRKYHPKLIVVLSGRYDITKRTQVLSPEDVLTYELPRFTATEAHNYLGCRGIEPGPTRDAIVERAGHEEDADESERLGGRNPFKLAMFAELALNRAGLTPEQVWEFPSVDIAYLIERVIRHIDSQALRWAIRYGAIARHFNEEFIEAVLLPPLRRALRGEADDHPNESLPANLHDTWEADLQLAESITAADIWSQLKAYARERGWVALQINGKKEELRFHPDVMNPTRELLRKQPIFASLQAQAIAYFEEKANRVANAAHDENGRLAAEFVENACEAVFHRFQLKGPDAVPYWRTVVRSAERFGPAWAAKVAMDITGRAYARQQIEPLKNITTAEVLSAAHCEAADLLLQAAGMEFGSGNRHTTDFMQRVGWATAIEKGSGIPVPGYLALLYSAAGSKSEAAVRILRDALTHTSDERERAFLICLLVRRLRRLPNPGQALGRYFELLRLTQTARRTGIRAFDVTLALAELQEETGNHPDVLQSFELARKCAADERSAAMLYYREALYFLSVCEPEEARSRVEELARLPVAYHPRRTSVQLLRARLALIKGDAFAVRSLAIEKTPVRSAIEQAQMLDLTGSAHAMLLEYKVAFDAWEAAGAAYNRAQSPTGATRVALLAARLTATECGHINDAASRIDSVARMRGVRDVELYAELEMLRAFTAYRHKQETLARGIFSSLLAKQSSWGAALRAKVLIFGLAFQLTEPDATPATALLPAINAVQPRSARVSLLEWCEYSEATLRLPDGLAAEVVELLAHPLSAVGRSITADFGLIYFLRLIGESDRAARYLAEIAHVAEVQAGQDARDQELQHWRINRALKKLQLTTHFHDLLLPHSVSVPNSPLHEAILLEAALEARANQQSARAIALAKVGLPFSSLREQGLTSWSAQIEELEGYAKGQSEGEAATRGADILDKIGDALGASHVYTRIASMTRGVSDATATHSPGTTINVVPTIAMSAFPPPASLASAGHTIELAIDELMGNWAHLASEMTAYLESIPGVIGQPRGIALDIPFELASLPWEMATLWDESRRCWRTSTRAFAAAAAPQDMPMSVLVIQPREETELSFSSQSGTALEHLYYEHMPGGQISTLLNPSPESVEKAILSAEPRVVHICAAVRETHGGFYLDFESTEVRADDESERATTWSGRARAPSLVWTTTQLARVFSRSPFPVTLVLDIPSTENLAETLRMMLLRNLFATQVFQLVPLNALLGAGLAHPVERTFITDTLLRGIFSDNRAGVAGAATAVRALRNCPLAGEVPGGLAAALPRLATALWTQNLDFGSN